MTTAQALLIKVNTRTATLLDHLPLIILNYYSIYRAISINFGNTKNGSLTHTHGPLWPGFALFLSSTILNFWNISVTNDGRIFFSLPHPPVGPRGVLYGCRPSARNPRQVGCAFFKRTKHAREPHHGTLITIILKLGNSRPCDSRYVISKRSFLAPRGFDWKKKYSGLWKWWIKDDHRWLYYGDLINYLIYYYLKDLVRSVIIVKTIGRVLTCFFVHPIDFY